MERDALGLRAEFGDLALGDPARQKRGQAGRVQPVHAGPQRGGGQRPVPARVEQPVQDVGTGLGDRHGLGEQVAVVVDHDAARAQHIGERVVLGLRPADPEHVVEQQVGGVVRGQPLELQVGAVQDDLPQPADLGVHVEHGAPLAMGAVPCSYLTAGEPTCSRISVKPPSGVITIRPVSTPRVASSRRRACAAWQIIRVSANASTGTVSTRTRNIQVTAYTEMWRWYAISSLAAAAHSSPYSVIPATPTPIRFAGSTGLGGSSPRGGRPPAIQPSSSGYAATSVKNSPGTITAGISTSSASTCPPSETSQPGMTRRAPSRKPMYQSGTEPALMLPG